MKWSPVHARLHATLKARSLLPTGTRILMAVSGGQDSLCMAQLLIDLQSKWQWRLGLVHCDHGWRSDSAQAAQHVMALAQERWQVPAWCEQATSLPHTEAAARQWRYAQFHKLAVAEEFDTVVTGHTASDRAETVLYNLLRGTGVDGLGSLAWVRHLPCSSEESSTPSIRLVRPLLDFFRQETADFCNRYQLPVWADDTNQDLTYRRNRIRQELMPYLEEHFNPQVARSLVQLGEIAAADSHYLQVQTAELLEQTVTQCPESMLRQIYSSESGYVIASDCWQIDRTKLSAAPISLQRRVIKRALFTAFRTMPTYNQIAAVTALLTAPNRSQSASFPDGWLAKVDGPILLLFKS